MDPCLKLGLRMPQDRRWGACYQLPNVYVKGFPGGGGDKEPTCQCRRCRDTGLIPGSGRSPGGGHGIPLQYSFLENPVDGGAWQATVHRATSRLASGLCLYAILHTEQALFCCWGNPPFAQAYVCVTIQKQHPYIRL